MKGYKDNGGATGGFGARNKTVYDDVFGGPPKFGATTLPPRLEDYTEIFQGFHASRGSSIPVLDLPPPSNEPGELWLDVQSSKLDYSEIFGGFNGLDFAVSYEKLFKSSKAADGDSSDDIWTPAQSESLSDDLDPYTSLEINQHVSTSDPIELYGITNDSQFHEIENEKLFTLANNDHSSSNHSERKQLKKSFSQPLDDVYDTERYYGSDYKDYRIENKKPHISVSDVSLKTQPSNLPPPSRPPPVLSLKKGDDVCFSSKLKTSRSYGFEKMKSDRSPPYFDVEIDASSSAAVDAMKDAVEQAQAKLKSAKELKDRKKEGIQNRSKSNVGGKMGNVSEVERSNGVVGKDEKIPFEEKEDFKNVPEREVCELEEKNEREETVDSGHEEIKEPICEVRGVETSFVDGHEHGETKTPSEVDESETYDNLIEIELKNNDMEPVVEEVVGENDKNTPYEWEEYGEAFEKEHEKEVKESEEEDSKEGQNPGPPEIIITQIEEEEDDNNGDESEEHEIIYEDLFHSEDNKKEETLNNNETILEEKDEIKEDEGVDADVANEEIETIHENENSELQKDHEKEEECEKMEEVNSENDVIEKEEESEEVNTENDVIKKEEESEEVNSEDDVIEKEDDQVDEKLSSGSKKDATPQAPFSGDLEGEKIELKKAKLENEKEKKEREKMEKERERVRKLEEERERQIEREKDRMATLEARERAFSETRAVERATAEYRQRALAEARERLEKACAEARERSLAEKAMEGRMRVEKATAEARQRAQRSVDDKFSYNGGEDESPQRCKARLERHQRTADRAAKALAEKNTRDLLAQKEQAERNRLAEGLDVEVKRWCSGKQGNLRALLSTLQYILGPDSGWQPVPLTEVITTAAVKKAYRKATLCVHPDKLQQRGATIQQKYICEKVFDLLKEAWNKFNSEER